MEKNKNLQEALNDLRDKNSKAVGKEISTLIKADIQRVADLHILENLPKIGEPLLNFNLPDQNGVFRTLDDLLQEGPLVLTFYRGGWCPYCNLMLRTYQQMIPDLEQNGAHFLAITPELPDASLSTKERLALNFDVLTDQNSEYARQLGIQFTLPKELHEVYLKLGIDITAYSGANTYDLPLAATLVVDTDKTVTYAFADADYTQRAEPRDILRVVESMRK